MKQHFIQFTERWQPSPMSFWVHIEADTKPWFQATTFAPPLPNVVPGKGYPRFYVEFDDVTFEFASLGELDVCIATLSQKLLPSTERETMARRTGPGSHRLNKLPARTKSWHYRAQAVKYSQAARRAFEHELEH